MLKKSNGITLIALVITIIVMLILVAVTINLAINGGLFDYAKRAATDTNTAVREEQELASLPSGLSTDDLIAKYTGGWQETEDGKFTNGDYTVEIGDYINYNCYNGTEYSESGFTVNSSSSSLKWQVIGVESGKLQIVSENSLGELELGGAEGYYNGASILNTICAIYGHGQNAVGARSIKIEDLDKITGYDPEHDTINNTGENSGKSYRYGRINQYKNEVTYTLTPTGIDYSGTNGVSGTWTRNNATLMKPGESTNTSPLTEESTYYNYNNSILSTDAVKHDLLFIEEAYWLASPYMLADDAGFPLWGMRIAGPVGTDGVNLWDAGIMRSTYDVRAIVSLKSDIKLTEAGTAHTWNFD